MLAAEAVATRSLEGLRARSGGLGSRELEWDEPFSIRFATRVAARVLARLLGRTGSAGKGFMAANNAPTDEPTDEPADEPTDEPTDTMAELWRQLRQFDVLTVTPGELQRRLDTGWRALEGRFASDETFAEDFLSCVLELERCVERWRSRSGGPPAGGPSEERALDGARLLGATYGALLSFTGSQPSTVSTRRNFGAFFTPLSLVDEALSLLPEGGLCEENRREGARVCDPACGAGAFLLEVAFEITRHRMAAREHGSSTWTEQFSRVVREQIYGVDIDEHAVDVCAMTLWLGALAPRLDRARVWPGLRIGNALLGVRTRERAGVEDETGRTSRKRTADEATAKLLDQCRRKITDADQRLALARPAAVFGLRLPVHWPLEFPEVFEPSTADGAGFDYVVGNPPFVDSERMTREYPDVRASIARRFETARGNWDLFVPFLELGFTLLRAKGCMSYVLPRVALAADYAAKAQALLLDHTPLEFRTFTGLTMFEEARVQICMIAAQKGAPRGTHRIRCVRDDVAGNNAAAMSDLIPVSVFKRLPKGFLALPLEPGSKASLEMLDLPLKVGDLADVGDGATTKEAYELRDLLFESAAEESLDECFRLVNTGTIDPFQLLWSNKVTRYLGRRLLRPTISRDDLEKVSPRRVRQATSCGVVLAGLARELEVAVVDGGVLCGKSTVQVLPEADCCPYALAAWLNSTPIRALYRGLFAYRGFGEGAMNIGPRQVRLMPLPERRWLMVDHGGAERARGEDTRLSRAGRELTGLLDRGDEYTEKMAELDRLVEEIVGAGGR